MKVPSLINLPKFPDKRGTLTFLEEETQLPYKIRRVYWIYDVPGGMKRGGHAFKENQEFIIALSGSFDLVLNDGINEFRYNLNRSYYGVLIPEMIWRDIENFSTNSLALIVASNDYCEEDYIRDFEEFRKSKGI